MLLEVVQFSNDTLWIGSKCEIPVFGSVSWSVISQALSLRGLQSECPDWIKSIAGRIPKSKYRRKMCLWLLYTCQGNARI